MIKKVFVFCFIILCVPSITIFANENTEDIEIIYNMNERIYIQEDASDKPISTDVFKQIMAAILLKENTRDLKKEMLVVYDYHNSIAKTSYVYNNGQRIQVQDEIHALLMNPAEDIFSSTAIYISKTADDFYEMMDKKAEAIGMNNTSFLNSYTTPDDLQKLVEYCMKDDYLYAIMQKKSYQDSSYSLLINEPLYELDNQEILYVFQNDRYQISLLQVYDSILFYFTSTNNPIDINNLQINLMNKYQKIRLFEEGEILTSVKLKGNFLNQKLEIYVKEDNMLLPNGIKKDELRYEMMFPNTIQLPIYKGDKLGEVYVYANNELIKIIHMNMESTIYKINQYACMGLVGIGICIFELYRKRKHYEK